MDFVLSKSKHEDDEGAGNHQNYEYLELNTEQEEYVALVETVVEEHGNGLAEAEEERQHFGLNTFLAFEELHQHDAGDVKQSNREH